MLKRELQLTFMTNNNKKVSISVPEPKEGLTSVEVGAAMDVVIAKGIFGFNQGLAVGKAGAKVVETNVEKIEV